MIRASKRISLWRGRALPRMTRKPYHANYYAMYSTLFGGIVVNPRHMLVPVDDHLVHRGDGLFEAFKCIHGNLYNIQVHLDRLDRSAAGLELKLPMTRKALLAVILETVRAGRHRAALIRLFVSRGPGGFTVDPYESPAAQLYCVVTRLNPPFMALHPAGARVCSTTVPVKPSPFPTIKHCNYVPNMLMKKAARDRGLDFSFSFDARGCLAEAPTENAGIVTTDRRLLFPRPGAILQGTTMLRVLDLAGQLVATGELRGAALADIPRAAIRRAAEVLLTGTTVNVTAAVEFDGRPVGDGKPGPVGRRLNELLELDMRQNQDILTPVFR